MMIKALSLCRFLFLASLLLLFSSTISARQEPDKPKRIEVKAGGPAVILSGEVAKDKDAVYVFSAKAGQKFSGGLTKRDGSVGFVVTDLKGDPLIGEEFDYNTSLKGSFEKTGDYKIIVTVAETNSHNSKYILSVRVY
jgi:hypothetical protein